jgi:hypothetical protein
VYVGASIVGVLSALAMALLEPWLTPPAMAQADEPMPRQLPARLESAPCGSDAARSTAGTRSQAKRRRVKRRPARIAFANVELPLPGRLFADSVPPTQIEIDGRERGSTPQTLVLAAGTYRVRFHDAERGIDHRLEVEVQPNERVHLRRQFDLKPAEPQLSIRERVFDRADNSLQPP